MSINAEITYKLPADDIKVKKEVCKMQKKKKKIAVIFGGTSTERHMRCHYNRHFFKFENINHDKYDIIPHNHL